MIPPQRPSSEPGEHSIGPGEAPVEAGGGGRGGREEREGWGEHERDEQAGADGHSGELDLRRFIPVARPVVMPAAGTTYPFLSDEPIARPVSPAAPTRRRAWRALFELIMLVPAGFFGQIAGYIVARSAGVTDEQWQIIASTIGMGAGCLAAVLLFLFINRERAAEIGWRSENLSADVGIGVAALLTTYMLAFVLVMTIAVFVPSILKESETAQRAVDELMPDMTLLQMALFMGFVSIWEEVVFRGFLLTRLRSLLRSWWLAVPLSSLLFGAVHIYEGPVAVGMITILGLAMAGLFIWRRSLVPCIAMHFLNNFAMLLLLDMEW